MKSFVHKVASFILEKEYNFQDLTIVLPTERSKKYLSSALFEELKSPFMAPKMVTMDAWIRDLSPKVILDKTRLLILLYEIHNELRPDTEKDTFEDFLEWGPILLSDFDEIDRYLVDVNAIFKDLHNIKELEYWKINADEAFKLSNARKKFLEFWDLLPSYYDKLQERLEQIDATYMGNAYKRVAEQIDYVFNSNKNSRFIFAGFNAMSKAELSILKQLYTLGRGDILVDGDTFYVENPLHEAGAFLRKQKQEFEIKEFSFIENQICATEKVIDVVECAQITGQVKVASTYLQQLNPHEIAKTLVLLADESLIGALLKNIPKNVGKANITLGLPMKGTAIRNWVDLIFSIQESKRRFRSIGFYHSDFKRLLNHPFISACCSEEELQKIQELEQKIIEKNWIFVSLKEIAISPDIDKLIAIIHNDWDANWEVGISCIRNLNKLLFQLVGTDNHFEKALLQSFDSALIDFENIVSEGLPTMSIRSFKTLFNQHWSNKGIAYHGNPIDGLQVMGLLETRLLDFENIVCLGLNEGTMPPTNPIQSMFPMDLRRYSGLPLPRDKQGLFAHHFYRLLHQSKYMLITYAGAKESVGSSEKSRYLLQIEKELVPKSDGKIKLNQHHYFVPAESAESFELTEVQKDQAIIDKLDALFGKSTSFTALKSYATCNLDFYYKYVLEFGDEVGVEELLEASSLGTILHEVFEKLYEKHVKFKDGEINPGGGLPLRPSDIDEMIVRLKPELEKAFLKYFDQDKTAFSFGKNNLSFQIAYKMMSDFLKEEKRFIEMPNSVVILHLEKNIKYKDCLQINGETKEIVFNGTIDRVDEVNGKLRLVDYKSGRIKEDVIKLKKNSSGRSSKPVWLQNFEGGYAMQLAMYCYLYFKTENILPTAAGLISLPNIRKGFISLEPTDHDIQELIELFPIWISELLEEMYDTSIPFSHQGDMNKEHSYCKYCF